MILFDGYARAIARETALVDRAHRLQQAGIQPNVVAVLFSEDAGSQLYTRLKQEAATRTGMTYHAQAFSMATPIEEVVAAITALESDPNVTGIIVQKPTKATWQRVTGEDGDVFHQKWQRLVTAIDPSKDIDGLHPSVVANLEQGGLLPSQVLPATAAAVWLILQEAAQALHQPLDVLFAAGCAILGKSDLLGWPLYWWLKNQGARVDLLGRKELAARQASGEGLKAYKTVISATGSPGCVQAGMLASGSIVIDVGEPSPDVSPLGLSEVSVFATPVPGGVGPLTISCLLENVLKLAEYRLK